MGKAKSSGCEGSAGPHLGGLLTEQAGPQPELALALQRGGLDVGAPHEDQVAVQVAVVLVGEVDVVAGVVHPFALGGEQLDQLVR